MIRKVFTLMESLTINVMHSTLTFAIIVINRFLHCYHLYKTPRRSSLDSSPSPTHQYLLSPMSNSSSAKPSPFRESRQGHGFGLGMYSNTDNTYGDQNITRWDLKIIHYVKVFYHLSTRHSFLHSHHQNRNQCLFDGHAISPSLYISISHSDSLFISLSISIYLFVSLSLSLSLSLSDMWECMHFLICVCMTVLVSL